MNLSEGNGGAATGQSHLWKPLTKYRTISFKKKKSISVSFSFIVGSTIFIYNTFQTRNNRISNVSMHFIACWLFSRDMSPTCSCILKLACEMNLLTGRSIGSPDGGFKSCMRGKSAPSRAKRIQTVQLNCITRDRLHREINNHYCVWRAGYLRAASSGRMKTQTVQPRGNDAARTELSCRTTRTYWSTGAQISCVSLQRAACKVTNSVRAGISWDGTAALHDCVSYKHGWASGVYRHQTYMSHTIKQNLRINVLSCTSTCLNYTALVA